MVGVGLWVEEALVDYTKGRTPLDRSAGRILMLAG